MPIGNVHRQRPAACECPDHRVARRAGAIGYQVSKGMLKATRDRNRALAEKFATCLEWLSTVARRCD